MRKSVLLSTAVVGAAAALAVGLSATAGAAPAIPAVATSAALGVFAGQPTGFSYVTADGANIRAQGFYGNLPRRSAFFTVIYGNTNCDPVAAFPIGPFYTNRHGQGTINQSVANPMGIVVGTTGSVSVRMGDTAADLDHDGKTGPTDVVAVPGSPAVGLIQCDSTPLTTH